MKKVEIGDSLEYLEYVWKAYSKQKCPSHKDCNEVFFKRIGSQSKVGRAAMALEVAFCDRIVDQYSKDPKSFYFMKILPRTIKLK